MLEPIKRQAFSYEPATETECLTQLTEVYLSLITECFGNWSKWHLAIEYSVDILFFLNNLIDHKNELSYKLLNEAFNNGRYLNNLIINRPRTGLAFIEKVFEDENYFINLSDEVKAILYEGRADCQYYSSFYASAMENYNIAQNLYDALGMNARAARVMNSKGELEYLNNNYTEAEQLYLDAKKIFEEAKDTDGLASVLMKLGVLYCELEANEPDPKKRLGKNESAYKYLDQARLLAEQGNNKEVLANIFFYMGEYYARHHDHQNDAALTCYNKALELYIGEQDNLGRGNVYRAIGDIFFLSNSKLALENYQQAIYYFRESEIPEGYYSQVSQRIEECNHHIERISFDETIDIEELIAKIDRKISELEAKETLEKNDNYNGRLSALVIYCETERTRDEMRTLLGLSSTSYFRKQYLNPLLQSGQIRMTIPDKPRSKHQKYIKA